MTLCRVKLSFGHNHDWKTLKDLVHEKKLIFDQNFDCELYLDKMKILDNFIQDQNNVYDFQVIRYVHAACE